LTGIHKNSQEFTGDFKESPGHQKGVTADMAIPNPSTRDGRPQTGWHSLTHAELRVARLVALGLSNRAVAERLVLSPHTVDTHLRHVFAKLSVRSRVQLTRHALLHDTVPDGAAGRRP
jgi:DNA-binding CsgD family transcriptional regulator